MDLRLKQTEMDFKAVKDIGINQVDFTGLTIWPC